MLILGISDLPSPPPGLFFKGGGAPIVENSVAIEVPGPARGTFDFSYYSEETRYFGSQTGKLDLSESRDKEYT